MVSMNTDTQTSTNSNRPRPLVLVILDGWGYREDTESNAIAAANKPTWDKLWHDHTHTLISGSGKCVGLPDGQMGNSEVGHLNMGAGRIVHQDLTRIDADIESGVFYQNKVLTDAIQLAKQRGRAVHIMGLLSPGGVHSHENQLFATLRLAQQEKQLPVFVHAFLDGRDTPPKSAAASLEKLESVCQQAGARIASMIGRYYAMDRDKRWDRVEQAYNLLVLGEAEYACQTAMQGLELAYARGETDEFVKATRIADGQIKDGDVVIFINFRADRAREITAALTCPDFTGFKRQQWPQLSEFVCLSEYDKAFAAAVAYPPETLNNLLGAYLSELGLKQLRIAETEKYAHVTFFFNGGVEQPYPGEDRILIPSPKVATYDLKPDMSAPELTDRLVQEINTGQYDVIICNFANPDMVGHTGNFEATVQAIETIDKCLQKITQTLTKAGGELIITADHGNAEQMFDRNTNQPHTAHTSDPVPFIYVGRNAMITKENGKLSDIAPTMLYLLNLPQPSEMNGQSLLKLA